MRLTDIKLVSRVANKQLTRDGDYTKLVQAVKYGNIEEINTLIISRMFDTKNVSGTSLLYIAANAGNFEGVKYLMHLYRFENEIYTQSFKNELLSSAINGCSTKTIDYALEYGANINAKLRGGNTPLHIATFTKNVHILKHILYSGAKLDTKNMFYRTPLHTAAQGGDISSIELLLAAGADVNALDRLRRTPLEAATDYEQKGAVDFLTKYIEARNKEEQTACKGIQSLSI